MAKLPIAEFRSQWRNPGDIFSLLLLLGPDVVQRAVARITGASLTVPLLGAEITPMPFSFGWVAFGINMVAAAWGERRLMPPPDADISVINCDTGYVRTNKSWLLARLVRDLEVRVKARDRERHPPADSTGRVSLMIDRFQAGAVAMKGREPVIRTGARGARIGFFAAVVIAAQLGVAAIPWILHDDWSIFLITGAGTLLSIVTASLPQWRLEKWSGRRSLSVGTKTVALTRGNGHQYLMLVECEPGSWDIEALASAREVDGRGTPAITTVCSLLWVLLLLSVTGIREHTWFLIAVGGMGMLQNLYLTAIAVGPDDFDPSLVQDVDKPALVGYQYEHSAKQVLKRAWKAYDATAARNEYARAKDADDLRDVMDPIMELEKLHPRAGAALLPVFYPGGLDYEYSGLHFNREKEFWKHAATRR